MADKRIAVIIGAGRGLSASLARKAAAEGMVPLLAARNVEKLSGLLEEVGGQARACDAGNAEEVAALFDWVQRDYGVPELVVYNPSARTKGPFVDLDPADVERAIRITAFGAFLAGQQAARLMLPVGRGSILFTGASAGVKGYAQSASFAMGKFAMRGLAQSMARELHPKGIHIGHFVLDGSIGDGVSQEENQLHPDAIAETYFQFHRQHRSAWAWEVELRPWVETF